MITKRENVFIIITLVAAFMANRLNQDLPQLISGGDQIIYPSIFFLSKALISANLVCAYALYILCLVVRQVPLLRPLVVLTLIVSAFLCLTCTAAAWYALFIDKMDMFQLNLDGPRILLNATAFVSAFGAFWACAFRKETGE